MTQEFLPYDQAVKIKQLGFDGYCFGYWNIDPYFKTPFLNIAKPFNHEWCLPAPTFSQAFTWFREKYADYLKYSFGVVPHFTIIQNLIIEDSKITYEEAELVCLNKLIEIVESKSKEK